MILDIFIFESLLFWSYFFISIKETFSPKLNKFYIVFISNISVFTFISSIIMGLIKFDLFFVLVSILIIMVSINFTYDFFKSKYDLYSKKLTEVLGIRNFLKNTNHNRLIGSNNIKDRIIHGLTRLNLIEYFNKDLIFSFDLVGVSKPAPDIYIKAIEVSKIDLSETVIIEDSLVGVKSGVAAGIKVIGITAGGHWFQGRSHQDLYDAGAYEVVNNYDDMLLLINKL